MLDKANRWLSRRIAETRARKQGSVSADAAGLVITRANSQCRIPWESLAEITAFRKSACLGDNLGLRIRCGDGTLHDVMEFDPAWHGLIDGLKNYLPGSLPYAQWSLRAAFTEPTGTVRVYGRP